MVAEGREEQFEDTWWRLYDMGADARVNGLHFDERRTDPWKVGWIDADIHLGNVWTALKRIH